MQMFCLIKLRAGKEEKKKGGGKTLQTHSQSRTGNKSNEMENPKVVLIKLSVKTSIIHYVKCF